MWMEMLDLSGCWNVIANSSVRDFWKIAEDKLDQKPKIAVPKIFQLFDISDCSIRDIEF